MRLLYPRRHTFHISEFTAFASVMALYHNLMDCRQVAEMYYQALKDVDPEHHLTEVVRRELYPTFQKKI